MGCPQPDRESEGGGWGGAGLGVKVEELIVLIFWGSRSTLRLATQVPGKINLLVNFCSSSTSEC